MPLIINVFLFKALGLQLRTAGAEIAIWSLYSCSCTYVQFMLFKTLWDAAPGLRVRTFACSSFFIMHHTHHLAPHHVFSPFWFGWLIFLFIFLFFLFDLFFVLFLFFLVLHANLSVVISFFQLMSGLLAASWLKWSGVVCCFQALIVSLSWTSI